MQSNDRKDTRVRALIREERRKQPPMRVMFLSDLDGGRPDKRTAVADRPNGATHVRVNGATFGC